MATECPRCQWSGEVRPGIGYPAVLRCPECTHLFAEDAVEPPPACSAPAFHRLTGLEARDKCSLCGRSVDELLAGVLV